ncbi:SNF2 family N-terminal domain-domain-containing protein [Naematelia encephala]|uniref:SNF2 family N-terminal domain-domain-containing protein n=1 Tax=Naematelia encephala TaxID=71784 RepID=A0A1Y2AMA6_9TREE|nr:SNF2 family N-terminal domain-domain-containing protein [Naematelia encephala]
MEAMATLNGDKGSSTPSKKSTSSRPGPTFVDLTDSPPSNNIYHSFPNTQPPRRVVGNSKLVPHTENRPIQRVEPIDIDNSFGASIAKPKTKPASSSQRSIPSQQSGYSSYIKPATPGAFRTYTNPAPNAFSKPNPPGYRDGWPEWAALKSVSPPVQAPNFSKTASALQTNTKPASQDVDENPGEEFDLRKAGITDEDYIRHQGDADEHMRELLSGAIGEGDDAVEDGDDDITGFADNIRLMPHQVRGVKWMRSRESGRKYGGILADDMGLGKTVQTLARIVEGVATPAERKAGYKGGTLIVAPLAVMEQWATECRVKTQPGRLKVTTHHGPSRTKSAKALEHYDIVITTFQTLASEFNAYEKTNSKQAQSDSDSGSGEDFGRRTLKKGKGKKSASALFDVKWLRVVIDEAQNIKNRNTKAAKASVGLRAKFRWCLTGTPIQNNVEELFSLFKFLRARPLDNWDTFRARISSLVKNGQTQVAMKRLHVVLKAIMLRRTKDATIGGKPILNLPERIVQVVQCDFDNEERAFYDALQTQTALTFNKFMKAGTAMANYTSVLTLLLRLRQACDHPSLVTTSWTTDADAVGNKPAEAEAAAEDSDADELADMLGALGVAGSKTCEICFVKLEVTDDKHCSGCVGIARKARAQSADVEDGLPPSSAKIRMLLKLLADVETRSGSKEKTIVFSQFTSFLNLVEPFLRRAGIKYVRYDGSMRNEKRQESLEKIKSSPDVRVILISFKAGSTGLNLTCCNNVILMDLWWNPALEDQAFDRAHRLGQKLNVNIFKLTIESTVEDRILTLQDSKRDLAKAALSGEGAKNLMKLTLNDIVNLFKSDG